ncbi:hypothetical protein QYM36_002334 [Artemia franciscana]|uniref:Ubiquitin fusion degradation protein 1 homolog n=1 Tax=Artemia franciscana TaxID=6661 RepID=A0AA88LH85_ARTSF|nr:hypothetical protein QYM36_002334 [Artemia franciscana]
MFGFPFMQAIPNKFVKQYRCYSVSMLSDDKQDLEKGGKIIMPPSALDLLTRLHISYPMMFKLSNEIQERMTHCGVLEFVAQEGRVHIPYWMMENLRLNEGDLIQIESVTLPVATYAKFQPQSVDFLDITNPKAVLENTLRNFACLTKGDIIAIMYNNKRYELLVLELKPKDAVSIIECDMNVRVFVCSFFLIPFLSFQVSSFFQILYYIFFYDPPLLNQIEFVFSFFSFF